MRHLPCVLLLAVVLIGPFAVLVAPAAGAEGESGNFEIRVLACDPEPARGPGLASGDPEECWRLDGVTVNVTTLDGLFIDSCISGQVGPGSGQCRVSPRVEHVIVTEDVATLPPGYVPLENPKRAGNYGEFAGTVFLNVPVTELQKHTGSVTIHNRQCPLEFVGTDYFGTCHDDAPPTAQFFVSGPVSRGGRTDAMGDLTVSNLPPGTYRVGGGPPGDFVRNTILCAPAVTPRMGLPIRRTSNTTIELELATGEQVLCDWFSVPEFRGTGPMPTPDPAWQLAAAGGESLTVRVGRCPAGHRPDCAAVPGAQMTAEQVETGVRLPGSAVTAIADDEGIVALDLAALGPGRIRLVAILPPPVSNEFRSEIVCIAGQGAEVRSTDRIEPMGTGVRFDVLTRAGDQIHCDVGFFPEL